MIRVSHMNKLLLFAQSTTRLIDTFVEDVDLNFLCLYIHCELNQDIIHF